MIDDYEGRDVSTFDAPGAYIQAVIPNNKTLLTKLRAEFVNIMCDVNPEHQNKVIFIVGFFTC